MPQKAIARARAFARLVHGDQVDQAGVPVTEHLERVARRLDNPHAIMLAYLHDTVEDTPATVADVELFFGPRLAGDVERLTRRADETYMAYIARVASGSDAAREVKRADLADHLARTEAIPPSLARRYRRALAALDQDCTCTSDGPCQDRHSVAVDPCV